LKIYISQGGVANYNVTNFPQNVPDKKTENRSVLGGDIDKVCGIFWGPPCIEDRHIWIWIWVGNFISTATLLIALPWDMNSVLWPTRIVTASCRCDAFVW